MTRYTPLWLQAGSYPASIDRRLVGALWPGPASSGGAATVAGGMVVNVAAGLAAVPTPNNTGSTLCPWDAPEPVTIGAAPGSGTNRIDVITVYPRGNDLDGGANNDFIFAVVPGSVAVTPTPPAVPAGQLAWYQVYVPGGAAALVAGNLTDVRPGGMAIPPTTGAGSAPRGYVAGSTGPASPVSATSATPVLTLTATMQAGRRYRMTVEGGGSQQTAVGSAFMSFVDSLALALTVRLWTTPSLPVTAGSNWGNGTGTWVYAPTSTVTPTWTLSGTTSAGTLLIGANQCQMILEDIGSQ